MCEGSEAGKRRTFWENGREADVPEHDPGSGTRWGWVVQVLVGGGFYLQGEGKTSEHFKGRGDR